MVFSLSFGEGKEKPSREIVFTEGFSDLLKEKNGENPN
jgi:hypothetical protein